MKLRVTPSRLAPVACAILVLTSCSSFGLKPLPERSEPTATESTWTGAWSQPQANEMPRHEDPSRAADGSVVMSKQPGLITAQVEPTRDVDGSEGGRMYILELYQKVIEEKDALVHRMAMVTAERDKLQEMLGAADQEILQFQGQISNLERQGEERLEQVQELSGRLLTAQIRRLEAEKLLLESKIEWIEAQKLVESESGDEVAQNP